MMIDPLAFFPLGPPPTSTPVQDPSLLQRIQKTVEFAARNGPAFIEEVRQKQRHSPEYAFLHGGEGSAYFAWALYCQLTGNHPSRAAVSTAVALPTPVPAPRPLSLGNDTSYLPEEIRSGWMQVLTLLNGTRESITGGQSWFMAHARYALGMAKLIFDKAATVEEFEKQLHLLYLVNDIMLKAQSMRPPGVTVCQDPITLAFRPLLGSLLRRLYVTAGNDGGRQQQPLKVVKIWSDRGVFPGLDVDALVLEMTGARPGPAVPSVPLPRPSAPPAAPPPPPPHHQHHYHGGGALHDGHLSLINAPLDPQSGSQLFLQQHQQQMLRMEPQPRPFLAKLEEPQPFDPLSFPPGLIPKLVEDKLTTDPPYTPLSPEDIRQSPVPPPPQMDDYLKARLDKFYAQLADYRPEVSFSDIEGVQHAHQGQLGGSSIMARGVTGGFDDGSGGFKRARGGGSRGLGYGAPSSGGGDGKDDDDVFASYRRMRSVGYHGGIVSRTSQASRKA